MKRVFVFIFLVFIGLCLTGCGAKKDDVIRIHIRANSNNLVDQNIKLCVRDDVVEYITPLIASCNNSNDVKYILSNNLSNIKIIADSVLSEGGFDYKSTIRLDNEYFPTRSYEGAVFPSDYYDALIIELGSGTGDNWWCVAYPPLCFMGEDIEGNDIKYKSKIIELINKFFG